MGRSLKFCSLLFMLSACQSVQNRASNVLASPPISPIPPKPQSSDLVLYDACKSEWLATGLPHREQPSFKQAFKSQRDLPMDRSYTIKGEKMHLHQVDIYNLERHMKPGGADIPASLRGIWWMDGNPVPEVVLSFADGIYDKQARTLKNPFNAPNGYLVTPSALGRAWWDIVYSLQATPIVRFSSEIDMEDPKFGQTMTVDVHARFINELNTAWPTTFISRGHWRRDTGEHCYNMRQIVDERGLKLPAYDYFVKQVKEQTSRYFGLNSEVLLQVRAPAEGGGLINSEAASERKILPPIPPKPVSKDLMLYDACKSQWRAAGLVSRSIPNFSQPATVRRDADFDRSYFIQGQKMYLNKIDIYNIEKHMKVGGDNLPASLRGIWWMDGNPVPEVVLSFADGVYDKQARTFRNVFNAPNGYLVTASILGRIWWETVFAVKAAPLIRFPAGFDIDAPKFGESMFVDVSTNLVDELPMAWPTYFISQGHWRRDTGEHCYNMRQIVDESGQKLPIYDYFVKEVQVQTKRYFGRDSEVLLQVRPVETH